MHANIPGAPDMRILFLGAVMALSGAATITQAQDAVELYLDPETGEVSSEREPGDVALGEYRSADALVAQQAAMARQLAALQARLERLEADSGGDAGGADLVSEGVESAESPARTDPEAVAAATPGAGPADAPLALETTYHKRKLRWQSEDGSYSVGLQNRAQMRYSTPFDSSPRSLADLDTDERSYDLRRIRTSLSGTVIDPRLSFHIEHDWNETVIRDFFLELDLNEDTTLWLGRGKALYNMEFWISSGRQQFIERTIAHSLFTSNRQQGAQLFGRLFRDTPTDLSYAIGVFTGRGGAVGSNDDDQLMYTSRLQWNALGGDIGSAHGDLAFSPSPRVNIAVAALTNRSDCTRFGRGANSCRSLPRFIASEQAADGQFDVEQAMAELRVHWNGFSLEGELNRKKVTDRLLDAADPRRNTTLQGGFIQAGLLPHGLIPAVPPQLEFALRYASVDQDDFRGNDDSEEFSGVANWFIDGHENKLSLEFSHIDLQDPLLQAEGSENRLRLQWDVRF